MPRLPIASIVLEIKDCVTIRSRSKISSWASNVLRIQYDGRQCLCGGGSELQAGTDSTGSVTLKLDNALLITLAHYAYTDYAAVG